MSENEKVVQEFRVIETEDGFRIELKGDKEELRRMIFGGFGAFARRFHFGFGQHQPGHEQHHGHEHRPHQHEHHGHEEHGHRPPWAEKAKRHGGRKHGGYDLGPWWDESPSPTENA